MRFLVLLLLLSGVAYADCSRISDGAIISKDIVLCSDTYDVPSGVTVASSGVTLDCGTAVLRGILGQSDIGVRLENVHNVTVRNCNVMTFNQGFYLKNVTYSKIEDNSILKNRIGIRLLESYENVIQRNSDKSYQVAVSAISSKFNVVMLGNKDIERSFCEVNSCNEFKEMNPCVSDDFYCSMKCSVSDDDDCGSSVAAPADPVEGRNSEKPQVQPETVEEKVDRMEREIRAKDDLTGAATSVESPVVSNDGGLSFASKFLIYCFLYLLSFFIFQVLKRR